MREPELREPDCSATPLIAAEGLGLNRNGRWLLRHVDLSVAPGEQVTVIGPNGGGKTTLLRLLLGLATPDEGQVCRRSGLTIGYMPQRLHIDSALPLTVHRLLTATRRAPRREVEEALAATGAEQLIDATVTNLSGGEMQRVLLARALIRRPDLLVLDEPAQAVDVHGQADLYRLIGRESARLGAAVLMVSHDLHLVMAGTNRVICLNGHVCCTGKPVAVSRDPEFLRLFGAGAAALAVYPHAHDHVHDATGEVTHAHGDHHHHHSTPTGADGAH